MQDTGTPDEGETWEHYIIPVHIWQTPDHAARLRALRTMSPDVDLRQAVATYVGEIVEGEGALEGIWVAEVH